MNGVEVTATDTAAHTADTPQLLLKHHLKELRLSTILREYGKVARKCAVEQVDYQRYLLRFQKQIASYELLIVDELGFVPLSKTGAELLFEMLSQRYERGSTLITSNLPFSGMDRSSRLRTADGCPARPTHPSRKHPRDEAAG